MSPSELRSIVTTACGISSSRRDLICKPPTIVYHRGSDLAPVFYRSTNTLHVFVSASITDVQRWIPSAIAAWFLDQVYKAECDAYRTCLLPNRTVKPVKHPIGGTRYMLYKLAIEKLIK